MDILHELLPSYSNVAWGAIGVLLGWFVPHLLSKDRDKTNRQQSALSAQKLEFLPLIDATIRHLAREQPLVVLRKHKAELATAAARFRVMVSDRRQKRFDQVWSELDGTKDAELLHNGTEWFVPGQGQDAELMASKKLLLDRLTRLYEFIEKA